MLRGETQYNALITIASTKEGDPMPTEPTLSHVAMWSEHGWKHVTVDEAIALNPHGRVSSRSGLFMCELCGQYVTLTNGDVYQRYFKHSSYETSKDCPDRKLASGSASYTYNPKDYCLPIRISDLTPSGFSLEIGLLKVPENIIRKNHAQRFCISDANGQRFEYAYERLNIDQITYMPVGSVPSAKYEIKCLPELHNIWPHTVFGIEAEGTLFDADTMKKLVSDTDVCVGKEYLLVSKRRESTKSTVQMVKVCEKQDGWSRWYVYRVKATDFSEEAAKFFLKYHARITEKQLCFHPVWPPYEASPYLIRHNSDEMTLYVEGTGKLHLHDFPHTYWHNAQCSENAQVVWLRTTERQQLITAGRTKVLDYLYLWKEELDETNVILQIDSRDDRGNAVPSGIHHELPTHGYLSVKLPYDGQIVILNRDVVVEKRMVKAGVRASVDHLQMGMSLQIMVGMDLCWSISFEKKKKQHKSLDDKQLLQTLQQMKGTMVPIGHEFGVVFKWLKSKPLTMAWIRNQINSGQISDTAFAYIRKNVEEFEEV